MIGINCPCTQLQNNGPWLPNYSLSFSKPIMLCRGLLHSAATIKLYNYVYPVKVKIKSLSFIFSSLCPEVVDLKLLTQSVTGPHSSSHLEDNQRFTLKNQLNKLISLEMMILPSSNSTVQWLSPSSGSREIKKEKEKSDRLVD